MNSYKNEFKVRGISDYVTTRSYSPVVCGVNTRYSGWVELDDIPSTFKERVKYVQQLVRDYAFAYNNGFIVRIPVVWIKTATKGRKARIWVEEVPSL